METTLDYRDEPRGRIFAEFNIPRKFTQPIVVSRYLPDNSTERIGYIYQQFSEGEGTIAYICEDRNAKQLFPPTLDYLVAEERFEQYAKQLTIQAIEKQREGKTQEFADRINELKQMRNKVDQEKDQNINRL